MKGIIFYFSKYIFRLLHITTYGLIFGNIFYDFVFGKRIDNIGDNRSKYVIIHVASSVILMISGFVNMVILVKENNYKKNTFYQIWKKLLIWKFLISFTLTPMLDKFIKDQSLCFKIRVYVVCILLIISPFLRFFREYCLTSQKKLEIKDKINTNKSN